MKKLIFLAVSLSFSLQAEAFVIGIKNFRSYYYSLQVVTGITPTPAIAKEYRENAMSRLPKEGRIDELNMTVFIAARGLAAMFCSEFQNLHQTEMNNLSDEVLTNQLADRILGRAPTPVEMASAKELASDKKNRILYI